MNTYTVESQQTVLVEGLTGPDGATQMQITTGYAQLNVSGAPSGIAQDYSGLIGPTLTAGQFRRAIATAAPAGLSVQQLPGVVGPGGLNASWAVNSVEADWDDESGQIELRFETTTSADPASAVSVERISFQVLIFTAP
ncbi:MAG TPA: hypothetical protein VIM30_09635 [Candidatus Limnocylindrales bacterium]